MNEEMFECFSLNSLNQKEDLDKVKIMNAEDFLRYDLSIFSEKEIVTTLISNETFSEYEKELIRVWATILKSKKLFEMAEGSNLTDVEFDIKLENVCRLKRFLKVVSSIDWKYVDVDTNDVYVVGIEGFYEEVALTMAKNKSLTVELIEKFDSRGVRWNYKNRSGESVLMHLCESKLSIDLLTCLLGKEIDINITDTYGDIAFIKLCHNPEVTLDMIELFFDKGVNMEVRDDYNSTPFMYLCDNESVTLDMLKLFFDKGVNIYQKDEEGGTSFTSLCYNKSITLDMLKLFFNKFDKVKAIDVNLEDGWNMIPFKGICTNSSITIDMVKLFLDRGADLNLRYRNGLNPLDCYIAYGGQNKGILKLLGQS